MGECGIVFYNWYDCTWESAGNQWVMFILFHLDLGNIWLGIFVIILPMCAQASWSSSQYQCGSTLYGGI